MQRFQVHQYIILIKTCIEKKMCTVKRACVYHLGNFQKVMYNVPKMNVTNSITDNKGVLLMYS